MLLLISIFVGAALLLQSMGEEKENRMVEMLITSTSPLSIMLGKVLALGATGLLQISIWVAAAAIVCDSISASWWNCYLAVCPWKSVLPAMKGSAPAPAACCRPFCPCRYTSRL